MPPPAPYFHRILPVNALRQEMFAGTAPALPLPIHTTPSFMAGVE